VAEPEAFAIDVFAVFGRSLTLSGWAADTAGIASIRLRIGAREIPLASFGRVDSSDVVAQMGPQAEGSRFEETIAIDPSRDDVAGAELIMECRNGQKRTITHLGFPRGQAATALHQNFHTMLRLLPAGALLEVGSRARSGITRRELVPDGWSYVGMDIMAGPNVDVVGDAHELTALFPQRRFDAVMAFSVIEHLMMPWKFALELNRVLNVGALCLITTHQAWPLHDMPWDFWRFSDRAWGALFNRATGFEIIEAQMGEPTFFVAQRCHAVTNFGTVNQGYLASNVLFRKTGETDLDWPVRLTDVTSTSYPVT
jgi:hypothetical protein